MSVVITTYTLASGLMQQGMTWWQAMLTILLGNAIVLLPMILNAHADPERGDVIGGPRPARERRRREVGIPERAAGKVFRDFDEVVTRLAQHEFAHHSLRTEVDWAAISWRGHENE